MGIKVFHLIFSYLPISPRTGPFHRLFTINIGDFMAINMSLMAKFRTSMLGGVNKCFFL